MSTTTRPSDRGDQGTAVNAHDGLIAACETALGFIEGCYLMLHKPGRCVTEPPIIAQLKAALSQARGGKETT